MSDEKIQLPDFLIAELFKNNLVALDTSKPKEAVPAGKEVPVKRDAKTHLPATIKFLGENKKKAAIVVNESEAVFLMEDSLTFLTAILKACNLYLADIAIINIAKQEVNYEVIKEELQAQNVLLFDVEPSAIKLPFLIPAFQIQKFDGCTVMVAPALSYLNKPTREGKLLKTKLWISLQEIFSIEGKNV